MKTQRLKQFLSVSALTVFILALIVSCSTGTGLKILKSELSVREFTGDLNVKSSMAAVTGTAINPNDYPLKNCAISVIFYDEAKNTLGASSVKRESLGAGENWSFTVQMTNSDAWKAHSYDISILSQ